MSNSLSVAGPKQSQENLLLPLKTDSTGNHDICLDQLYQGNPARQPLVSQAVRWFIDSPAPCVKGLFGLFWLFCRFFLDVAIYTQYSIKKGLTPLYQGFSDQHKILNRGG